MCSANLENIKNKSNEIIDRQTKRTFVVRSPRSNIFVTSLCSQAGDYEEKQILFTWLKRRQLQLHALFIVQTSKHE